jgi:hypothetical protein
MREKGETNMNTKSNFIFWWRWLVGVDIGVILFGLTLVLFPSLARQAFSLMVFSEPSVIETFPPDAVNYITLSHGVMGSVMFGWGVAMMFTLFGQFREGVRMGWLNLALSIGLWYLPDTYLSLQTGFWQNAILNTVFAILFAIPLGATYRSFRPKATSLEA